MGFDDSDFNFDFDSNDHKPENSKLVPTGGKLPCCFQVPTSKLLDVIMALAPSCQKLDTKKRRKTRAALSSKLYNKTRPGFYLEVAQAFHIAYVGQPQGHGTQHHWRIFCSEQLQAQVEISINGSALTVSSSQDPGAAGNHSQEWGGLYLRSEAEVRIAKALDRTGVLFFANARGRVGLQNTVVSNDQLTGRVEADFMVIHQGRCMVLEVDGQHHSQEGQTIRDYARDRVLLRSGLPTVRFRGKECLDRPDEVVSEFLSILLQGAMNETAVCQTVESPSQEVEESHSIYGDF